MDRDIKKPQKNRPCSYCEGTGVVFNRHFNEMNELPIVPCPQCVLTGCRCGGESPYLYNEKDIIKPCSCRESRMKIDRILGIYNKSGIDKHYRWKRWTDFKASTKQMEKAKTAAYDIVMNFPNVQKGLFLWGNPGTGKTLLSIIILTELIIKHAVEGRFVKISRNFFNRLKATFYEGSSSYGESSRIEREYADVDILVIDDFGVQRDTQWEQETLYNLVDARYEAEKFTIFTSNKNPYEDFKELSDGRILSRIKEMSIIMELTGKDYRETI